MLTLDQRRDEIRTLLEKLGVQESLDVWRGGDGRWTAVATWFDAAGVLGRVMCTGQQSSQAAETSVLGALRALVVAGGGSWSTTRSSDGSGGGV